MLDLLYADVIMLPGSGPVRCCQLKIVFSKSIEQLSSDIFDVIVRIPDVASAACGIEGNIFRVAGFFRDVEQTLRFILAIFKKAGGLNPDTTAAFTDRIEYA